MVFLPMCKICTKENNNDASLDQLVLGRDMLLLAYKVTS
jgi:hypothetical protein